MQGIPLQRDYREGVSLQKRSGGARVIANPNVKAPNFGILTLQEHFRMQTSNNLLDRGITNFDETLQIKVSALTED
ncbi:hypothetical protein X802_09520 [Thermococcus guaymasensis DSM 11113]|uniref:Uncharacterized protein n=1 Tax=Thermococcus guaymasensis DSM 11113 TaxID=1432656 RepID=A0A0X1KNI2_9EURY|nr:hypothetical protein X802_09520 [Thermococcus guaymasensis DSM 11113]